MKTSSNISTRKLVIGSVAVVVLAAAVFFFTFFQVKTVEVIGNDHYTEDELKEMLKDDTKPVYVAADENDVCLGYAFCQLKQQPFSNNMVPFTSLFIDDLCVDAKTRGQHVGESLFEYVKGEAKRLGCYEVTLNVWAGNTSAEKFYEKMGMKTKERQMEYILDNL